MPPPTLRNRATEVAPKAKPSHTWLSSKKIDIMVKPKRPRPTTEKPITAPLEKAILNALAQLPIAALAVLALALVAIFIPRKPAKAEVNVPKK